MGLDIRLPMGAFFSLIGALLAVYGLFADRALYDRSLGMNVNLAWGVVVLVFGLVLLYLSRRGTSASRLAERDPEGRAIEERELVEGLESENPVSRPPRDMQ